MNKITEKLKETISYMSLFFNAENEYTTELMQKNPYKIQDLIIHQKSYKLQLYKQIHPLYNSYQILQKKYSC